MNLSLIKYRDAFCSFFKEQWGRFNPSIPDNQKRYKSLWNKICEKTKPYFFHALGIIAAFFIIYVLYLTCLVIAQHHIVGKVINFVSSIGFTKLLALIFCFIIILVKWEYFNSFAKKNIVVFSLLLLYVFFHRYWETLIRDHIIDTFLSQFERKSVSDIIFGFVVAGSCFLCYFNREKIIKQSTAVLCLVSLAFWGYYRFHCIKLGLEASSFDINLKQLSCNDAIMYVDIVPFYALSILISPLLGKLIEQINKIRSKDEKNEDTSIKGFIRDYPIDSSKDFLGRKDIARHEMKRLLATDTTNGSFTYGIDAPWGAGKTSFMIMMKELVCPNKKDKQESNNQYDNITLIDFNPWLYSEGNDLVTVFMDELSKTLKHYDLSLAKNILDYSKLLSAFNTNETKVLSSLIDLVHQDSTLKEKKKHITEAIRRIQRKIVVFVDDLDRLDANEIMEMMKLIRNISDFPNMYFIAAYDKQYLIQCLNRIMPTKGADFIGKIFQHEYPLPPSSNVINSIAPHDNLGPLLNEKDRAILFPEDDSNNKFPIISNLREAKRFANSFSSHYSTNMSYSENQIKSIYILEFFKIRYPLAFAVFENNWEKIVTEKQSPTNSDKTYCELNERTSSDSSFDYKTYIEKNYKQLRMNDEEKLIINEVILPLLFGENGYLNRRDLLQDYFNPTFY